MQHERTDNAKRTVWSQAAPWLAGAAAVAALAISTGKVVLPGGVSAASAYTLAPVDNAGGSDTVKASWTPLVVTPKSPKFMGDGDCELVQSMKDLITQNFSLRDMEYRTDCVPHQLTMDGFAVKGQVLRTLPVKSTTVKG